jgi:uncharacterized protein (TIGR00369 family)
MGPPHWLPFVERPFPSSNIVVIAGDKPVLVDTGYGSDLARTEGLLAERGIGPADLSLVVNTHHHSDHVGGNAGLRGRHGAPAPARLAPRPSLARKLAVHQSGGGTAQRERSQGSGKPPERRRVSEYAGQPTEESSGGHDAGERVRASFARQGLMRLLGAEVVEVGEGTCVIEVPFAEGITQQESYFHGVVTGAIADTADGYAAMTLAPPDREVLTVEYKVNFLAPAHGEKLVARGEVVTAGRRLFVCRAEVSAV